MKDFSLVQHILCPRRLQVVLLETELGMPKSLFVSWAFLGLVVMSALQHSLETTPEK